MKKFGKFLFGLLIGLLMLLGKMLVHIGLVLITSVMFTFSIRWAFGISWNPLDIGLLYYAVLAFALLFKYDVFSQKD